MKVNDASIIPPVAASGTSGSASESAASNRGDHDALAAAGSMPAREFWRGILDGSSPGLDLPYDFPRPAGAQVSTSGRRLPGLAESTASALRELARVQACDVSEIVFAAFAVLLHRWTQQVDFVCGRRFHSNDESESALLPQRIFADPETGFLDFLKGTRDASREIASHSLPLADIASACPQSCLGGALFHAAGGIVTGAAVDGFPRAGAGCDLVLHARISPAECELGATYDANLFLPETIERMLDSFATLLRGIVAEPASHIGDLPIVPAPDLERLLVRWNDTAIPYERNLCIHEAFERQVRLHPERVAVVGEGERLTYAQLNESADRLASALRANGVGPETLVGIYQRRTPRLVAGILGILKAGGAYVPLDPDYPAERLRFIIEDSCISVLVTEEGLDTSDLPADLRIVCRDALPAPGDAIPMQETRSPKAENLAYVIYTSGSTGKPKGVCLTHRAVLALTAWAQGWYGAEELAGVLFATSASFDVSIFECLVPLCLGGKIVVAPNLLAIGRLAARDEVKLVSGVPSAMAEVLRAGAMPKSVRTVNVAGEACPQSLIDDLHALGHVENVHDVYGPTETTVYSIGGPRRSGGRATIGKPLPNERAYVLDARLKPVPPGVRGELFIGGEKLARGYLNRPALTAEKFINVASLGGQRVYRTGDAARWRSDGTLEFLGRLDRQVKIRGYRVEPGEVENVLRRHDAVSECVVVPRDDAGGAKMLVAYVVGTDGSPDVAALREDLGQRLPEYLVPTSFVLLPSLPRSPNGKLDLRALPAPGNERGREKKYAPPRDGVEQQLVRVWEEVLNVKPIGIHDRFLDVGGHSLLAVRMVGQVEKKFGRTIPASILFRAPTIERLARAIREEGLISVRSCVVEIQPEGTRRPIFWLHTLGGGAGAGLFRYEKLARCLGPDQPSYGLVAPNGEQPPTFEAMADFYIREIRAVQPSGPYCVGGYCFGGVLAYEVARQLEAGGAGRGVVIILDGLPPNPPGMPGFKSWTFVSHFLRTLPRWLAARMAAPRDLMRRFRGVVKRFQPSASAADAGQGGTGGKVAATEQLEDFIDMQRYPAEFRALAQAHWRAMSSYRPRPFGGRVVLLQAHRPSLLKYPPEFQWGILASDVDVAVVPGSHSNMLEEPQVESVAGEIRRMLDEAGRA